MKKLIAAVLSAMLIMTCLIGCTDGTTDDNNVKNNGVENTSNVEIEFWTDEETGVQYVVYAETLFKGGMGGITPRLNADGSVYIVD